MINTGIDVIQISRVAEKINKNVGFLDIILTENEKKYCNSKVGQLTDITKNFQSIAGIYAVKEAFFKAIGQGIKRLSDFQSVEVDHEDGGRPFLKLLNLKVISAFQEPIKSTSISISHDGDTAVAICVIET